MTPTRHPPTAVWRRPVQLAILTALGLLSALFGTGVWRLVAWICLAVPVLAGVRYLVLPGRLPKEPPTL